MEVQIGIIAACGPTLRQILVHILPSSESFRYLISRFGPSQPSRREESSELPTFVKMADSVEHLYAPEQAALPSAAKTNSRTTARSDLNGIRGE